MKFAFIEMIRFNAKLIIIWHIFIEITKKKKIKRT